MIGTVSGNPLISGMRVDNRAAASGARLAVNSQAGGPDTASGDARKPGITENFKNALQARIERFQKSGQTENTDPEAGGDLVNSLGQAAAEVREVYGQEAANAFMAGVLKKIDEKGFSQETLTDAVGASVREVAQTGNKRQLEKLSEYFNRDLGLTPDESEGRAVKGLSQAVANFFGLEPQKGKDGPVAQGLTTDGQWGEVAAKDPEEAELFVVGTEEAAQLALQSNSALSLSTLGEETTADLANFLRGELGAENAATFLEEQSGSADFLTTMDTVIDLALKEAAPEDAAKLEKYLNDQVKNAVNAIPSVNHNLFGNVEFEGWTFNQAPGADGAPGETTYTSKWRYTNRDDVTFTRTGQTKIVADGAKAAGQTGPAGQEEEEDGNGGSLADLIKKVAKGSARTGELVDTQA